MPYDMCVMQWLKAKTNKRNKLMLKAEVISIVIRSETKCYSMLKTYLPR